MEINSEMIELLVKTPYTGILKIALIIAVFFGGCGFVVHCAVAPFKKQEIKQEYQPEIIWKESTEST